MWQIFNYSGNFSSYRARGAKNPNFPGSNFLRAKTFRTKCAKPFLTTSLRSAFGKRVSRRGRDKRDSEEVWLYNFVYLGGGRPQNEETVETLLIPVIFPGRAAENNVGQDARVRDMMTMWSPYDQSRNLGRPASKKVGPEDRVHDMREMWSSYDQSCKLGGPARKKAGRGVRVWKMSMS